MIADLFIDISFNTVTWLLQFISPAAGTGNLPSWLEGALHLMRLGAAFLPMDIIAFCVGSIITWIGIQMSISLVMFILEFIPFF